MSQEKVERYKQEKANRKQTIKKEKFKMRAYASIFTIIAIALVGWFGYSAYTEYENNKEVVATEINLDSIDNYLSTLS